MFFNKTSALSFRNDLVPLPRVFRCALLSVFLTAPTLADEKTTEVSQPPIVSVLSGPVLSKSAAMASELSQRISSNDGLRVMSSIGNGGLANANDLLSVDHLDIAFVNVGILRYLSEVGSTDPLHYIGVTHVEELHLLAQSEFSEVDQLSGKTVNVGPNVGDTYIVALEAFERIGIEVVAQTDPHLEAYRKLKAGQLDAMVVIDGTPSQFLKDATLDDGIRLVPIDFDGLTDDYKTTTINHDHYPNLLAFGEKIPTVGIKMALIAYNWPDGSEQKVNVDAFVERFIDELPALRTNEHFETEWKEADLWTLPPTAWERHPTFLELANPLTNPDK